MLVLLTLICRFHICHNNLLIKLTYNSKINTHGTSTVIHMHRVTKRFSLLMHLFPSKVKQGDAVYLCFSFQTIPSILHIIQCNFFLHVLCFLLVISLFKIASKCNIEMLSSVPKCKKATKQALWRKYTLRFTQA